MKTLNEETVGSIVANDFRTAGVFSKYGIDFCCKGGKTISEACAVKNINVELVEEELALLSNTSPLPEYDFNKWSLNLLADYIEDTHHQYVKAHIPLLTEYLDKLCRVHGELHPELFEIRELFVEGAEQLMQHMQKEERILFPYIRKIVLAMNENSLLETPAFVSVSRPLAVLEQEHETEGERFRKISGLTNQYTPPPDGCTTYRVAFLMLKEFEEDLHLHIHLENNLLFPGSMEIEKELLQRN